MLFDIIVISISLSIDALGIGIAYGLKNVRITAIAKMIIGIVSGGIMWLSLIVGGYVNKVLPPNVTKIVGVGILVLMGVIYIRNSLFSDEEAEYDLDKSFGIEGFEAVILAFALSADSVSTGIAVASMGIGNLWIPVVVGVMQVCFLSLGSVVIRKFLSTKLINSKVCGVFSGALLILIAILRGR